MVDRWRIRGEAAGIRQAAGLEREQRNFRIRVREDPGVGLNKRLVNEPERKRESGQVLVAHLRRHVCAVATSEPVILDGEIPWELCEDEAPPTK